MAGCIRLTGGREQHEKELAEQLRNYYGGKAGRAFAVQCIMAAKQRD